MDIDTRFLAYLVWGMGTTLAYGISLYRRAVSYGVRHDVRSRREVTVAVGLFITALFANLAILFVLFGDTTQTMRGVLAAIALGAFFAVGVLQATENQHT